MNILIHCDGSLEIGMGHIVRCLALADHLHKNHSCNIQFAIRRSELGISKVKESYRVFESNEATFDYGNWLSDCIHQTCAEILIIDTRDGLKRKELKQLKKKTGIKVVIIDDPEDKRLEADLAFYPPIPQLEKWNWNGFNGEIYAGWEYVILRKEFSNTYPKPNNPIFNILVSMGGTDELNMTMFVIDALSRINKLFMTTILLGPGYLYKDELISFLESVNYEYKLHQNPNNISEIMSIVDFGIISFGVTAYELAALKIPGFYLCLTADHEESSQLFVRERIGKSLGQYSKVKKQSFETALTSLFDDHSQLNTMSDQAGSLKVSDLDQISSLLIK